MVEVKMEVFQLTITVNASGHLVLDIPTQLSPGLVNIVLVLSSSVASKVQNQNYDFSDLSGRLNWRGDAAAIKRALRDEW
ncbi:MAG: hypothetical protein RIB93_17695 [Coleofasciculus sp. D1-CHI-01]|uniref:hypothetical protein n=1 Tax=Coleofasciculus sp. D1-CHI-01 TaxID=3068482 RepID=UPI0032FA950A